MKVFNFLIVCITLRVFPNTHVSATLFSYQCDDRCFYSISQLLQTSSLRNDLQCAALCSMSSKCGSFMTVKSNASCQLYSTILSTMYNSLTYEAAGQCRIALMINPPAPAAAPEIAPGSNYIVFNTTTTWTVPAAVYSILGLCIGGGGGGAYACVGGSGSGYIAYGTVSVTPGSAITVTIGSGGAAGNNGETSSIGMYINATGGRYPASTVCYGGDGGSGGGSSGSNWGTSAAAGGSGGSNGNGLNSNIGGTGQGSSVWSSAVAWLNLTKLQITFGSGGGAISNTLSSNCPGGGGGGGILLNGTGPKASDGLAPGGQAGLGGYGYGAGAGSGGDYSNSWYDGSNGASGVCIIKWI